MAKRKAQKTLVYEGAAGRYRILMMNSRDPARRRMLEEMIARELETIRRRADGAGWTSGLTAEPKPAAFDHGSMRRNTPSFKTMP